MQQTLAVFNQPFHQIEAPSQPLVSKSCGLSSGVSQLLHGNCQFLSAKKAASTLQSTSCYNLRFAQGWRGSTKIGGIFLRLPKSWKYTEGNCQHFWIYLQKSVAGGESLTGIWHLGGIFLVSGWRRLNLSLWFCHWRSPTFLQIWWTRPHHPPRPFSAAGRFRDTRVIGENFNGGGLWAVWRWFCSSFLKVTDGFRWEHDVSWY